MKLNLERDIIFFDIEATGLNVVKDRIVQLAIIKKFADDRPDESRNILINPRPVPIAPEAYEVHKISQAMVRDCPTFDEIAEEIFLFIGDADIAGYNSNRFDIPMLMEEFARAKLDFTLEGRNVIDVQTIFHKMEPRTLGAAHRKFVGTPIVDAHDAMADVQATIAVLESQLDAYDGVDLYTEDEVIQSPIKNDMKTLHEFTQNKGMLDVTRRLKMDVNGTVVFNFGKYIGRPVGKIVYEDSNYYYWIQNKEFSHQVKKLVKQLRDQYAKFMESDPQ